MKKQVLAYGGGIQSVTMCILAAKGVISKPDHIVFADTSREVQSTHNYRDEVMRPWLSNYGMEIEIADHKYAMVDMYDTNGGPLIPAYTTHGQLRTFCSNEWKARVTAHFLRARYGYTSNDYESWIGFSYDERKRIKSHDGRRYPLSLLVVRRADCIKIIESEGLPIPHKSRCWCCPFQNKDEWNELESSEELEQAIAVDNEIRTNDEYNALFLHYSRKPLTQSIVKEDPRIPLRTCQLGMCFV